MNTGIGQRLGKTADWWDLTTRRLGMISPVSPPRCSFLFSRSTSWRDSPARPNWVC